MRSASLAPDTGRRDWVVHLLRPVSLQRATNGLGCPRPIALYQAKKLKPDGLIPRAYRSDEAAQAFADLEAGRNAHGVIVF